MKQNNKGQIMPLAIVLVIIAVLMAIFVVGDNKAEMEDEIGKDQNDLMNSYTIAEGSRFYIYKSAKYSVISSIDEECKINASKLESEFNSYLKKIDGKKIMDLYIIPPEIKKIEAKRGMLTIDFEDDLSISNCPRNCEKNFKIKTGINVDTTINLSESCKKE